MVWWLIFHWVLLKLLEQAMFSWIGGENVIGAKWSSVYRESFYVNLQASWNSEWNIAWRINCPVCAVNVHLMRLTCKLSVGSNSHASLLLLRVQVIIELKWDEEWVVQQLPKFVLNDVCGLVSQGSCINKLELFWLEVAMWSFWPNKAFIM